MSEIKAGASGVTLINTFVVAPGDADRLVTLLDEATDGIMRDMPGFMSANIHKSLDGTLVVNYAQWRSKEDFETMRANPEAAPHMRKAAELAERFEPVLYEVVSVHDV